MSLEDRRPERAKRGSTRNESCGVGGNESPRKPPLKKKEETVPVRKPKFSTGNGKSKGKKYEKDPGKIREPKPSGMSLNDPVKTLEEFNGIVNSLTATGLRLVDGVGGFSAVSESQRKLLKTLRKIGSESLPPELVDSFSLLEKTTRSKKYVRKVAVKNPKPGGRKFRYIYD